MTHNEPVKRVSRGLDIVDEFSFISVMFNVNATVLEFSGMGNRWIPSPTDALVHVLLSIQGSV